MAVISAEKQAGLMGRECEGVGKGWWEEKLELPGESGWDRWEEWVRLVGFSVQG